jgi:hypothetical protein
VLIAADDALKSAAVAGDRTSEEVDEKFREAINLLSGFEKDFLSQLTSDPKIGGKLVWQAKTSDESETPLTILNALKENLHAKVSFPSISLPLNADNLKSYCSQWAIKNQSQEGDSIFISLDPFLTPTLSSWNVGATLSMLLLVSDLCVRATQ